MEGNTFDLTNSEDEISFKQYVRIYLDEHWPDIQEKGFDRGTTFAYFKEKFEQNKPFNGGDLSFQMDKAEKLWNSTAREYFLFQGNKNLTEDIFKNGIQRFSPNDVDNTDVHFKDGIIIYNMKTNNFSITIDIKFDDFRMAYEAYKNKNQILPKLKLIVNKIERFL